MKSLLDLHTSLLQELGQQLGVDTSRDIETLVSRTMAEGDSFLTITLPSFESSFLRAVSLGQASSDYLFPGFHRGKACLPVFLKGFTQMVFDHNGILLCDASSDAVRAVRQICSVTKKVERPVTPDRLLDAQNAYVDTDKELESSDARIYQNPASAAYFRAVAEWLFRDVLDDLESAIANFELSPRHGPGATAEGFSPLQKWDFSEWYQSIDEVFPSSFYTFCRPDKVRPTLDPSDERPVKIRFVPKTMKAPRVIAMEPAARMFVQQAVAQRLYDSLSRVFPASLDLRDQETNRAYAWYGSITGEVATLDLSEASDRVSSLLVDLLIGESRPHIVDAFAACRTPRAELPDGSVVELRKFASMGSALTFPVQSMVFLTLAYMVKFGGRIPSPRSYWQKVSDFGYSIFGDDIIVPRDESTALIGMLEAFGLKVNQKKSFLSGKFRESCGAEFFAGDDVSIAKLKLDPPSSRGDAEQIGSLVAFRNDLYQRGLWQTCAMLDNLLSSVIPYQPAPIGHPTLSRWTYLEVPADRISERLQRDEIRRPVLRPVGRKYKVDGEPGLLKYFLDSRGSGNLGSKFEPTERPVAFAIYNRWSPLAI